MKQHFHNKGQITIFVIIGAILLLGVGLFIFLSQDIQSEKPAVDVPDVSLEARPVIELVSQCLDSTAKEALYKVGQQGGYTQPLEVSYPAHKGEAVDYTPFSVPYWRHLTDDQCSSPSGCDATEQPGLCDSISKTCNYMPRSRTSSSSVEENLESFVLDNIGTCIDGFSSLEMYEIEENGEPEVNVILANGKTDFVLNYPIEIRSLTQEGNKKEVERFRASFDVDLVNMYRLADEIVAYEREHNIYEGKTLDLINMYSGLDQQLPPTSELMIVDRKNPVWIHENVKLLMENEVLPYMMLMSVANSNNPMTINKKNDSDSYNPYVQGIYKGFLFAPSKTSYSFNVFHKYTFSPIHLMIDDGDQLIQGKKLVPEGDGEGGVQDMLNLFMDIISFVMKDYRFSYDVSYPIVIEIEDPEAFNGNGYTFQFALEVNIRDNQIAYRNFTQPSYPVEFQSNIGSYDLRPKQNITIKSFDKRTGEPLEGVSVSYTCGDEYDIGATTFENNDAVLTDRFPYCQFGGFITFKKFGYMGTSIQYNNRDDGLNEEFEVSLWPLEEKELYLKVRSPHNVSQLENDPQNFMLNYQTAASALNPSQTAFFSVKRQPTSAYETPVPVVGFAQFVGQNSSAFANMNQSLNTLGEDVDGHLEQSYLEGKVSDDELNLAKESIDYAKQDLVNTSEEELDKLQSHTMQFVPGNYTVDLTLLYNDLIHIEEYETDDVTYPEQNFTTWLQGANTFNFTLTEEDVYNNDSITFFMLEIPLPAAWEPGLLFDKCDSDELPDCRLENSCTYDSAFKNNSTDYCLLAALYQQGYVAVMKNIPDPVEYQDGRESLIKPIID
ncbi:MAG: hypothetical protein ACQESE_01720 [Nanobdellota archaeon]